MKTETFQTLKAAVSKADWRVSRQKKYPHQVALHKTFGGKPAPEYSDIKIIVSLDGYETESVGKNPDQWNRKTKGYPIRMSMNGPAPMTTKELYDMLYAVEHATLALEISRLENESGS